MDNPDDLNRLGACLLKAFPGLGVITPLRELGNGFSSVAIETAEGLVFRIGKNDLAAQGYIKEAQLLPVLAGYLPVSIPNPQWHVPASSDFPFGVIGYRKLPGMPLPREDIKPANQKQLAAALGNFLRALHTFPIERASGLSRIGMEYYSALRDKVLPSLRSALTNSQYQIVAHWWETFLADEEMKNYHPVVQHGDLWYENILVDEPVQRVTGILDFEAMAIGDAVADFASLLYLGKPFVAQVLQYYADATASLDENFVHRLNRWWELREFGGIAYSVQYNDAAELADSIRKIREGPILNPQRFRL
jgi:aminoglycoside phosphotransferase (APT) family kinase protein